MEVAAGADGALEVEVRPRVPMPYVQALPGLAALAVCEQLGADAQILWPATVIAGGAEMARATVRAGYDEGIVARISVILSEPCANTQQLHQAVLTRIDTWEQAVCAGRCAAGPFAQFAGDYFDRMAGMGEPVDLLAPNGRAYCEAQLEGLDMWGRICVRAADGSSGTFSSEQVSLRLKR